MDEKDMYTGRQDPYKSGGSPEEHDYGVLPEGTRAGGIDTHDIEQNEQSQSGSPDIHGGRYAGKTEPENAGTDYARPGSAGTPDYVQPDGSRAAIHSEQEQRTEPSLTYADDTGRYDRPVTFQEQERASGQPSDVAAHDRIRYEGSDAPVSPEQPGANGSYFTSGTESAPKAYSPDMRQQDRASYEGPDTPGYRQALRSYPSGDSAATYQENTQGSAGSTTAYREGTQNSWNAGYGGTAYAGGMESPVVPDTGAAAYGSPAGRREGSAGRGYVTADDSFRIDQAAERRAAGEQAAEFPLSAERAGYDISMISPDLADKSITELEEIAKKGMYGGMELTDEQVGAILDHIGKTKEGTAAGKAAAGGNATAAGYAAIQGRASAAGGKRTRSVYQAPTASARSAGTRTESPYDVTEQTAPGSAGIHQGPGMPGEEILTASAGKARADRPVTFGGQSDAQIPGLDMGSTPVSELKMIAMRGRYEGMELTDDQVRAVLVFIEKAEAGAYAGDVIKGGKAGYAPGAESAQGSAFQSGTAKESAYTASTPSGHGASAADATASNADAFTRLRAAGINVDAMTNDDLERAVRTGRIGKTKLDESETSALNDIYISRSEKSGKSPFDAKRYLGYKATGAARKAVRAHESDIGATLDQAEDTGVTEDDLKKAAGKVSQGKHAYDTAKIGVGWIKGKLAEKALAKGAADAAGAAAAGAAASGAATASGTAATAAAVGTASTGVAAGIAGTVLVIVIIVLVFTALGDSLETITHQVASIPLAAYYYTDGTASGDADQITIRSLIYSGIEYILGVNPADYLEDDKILITQAAVNDMYEYQESIIDELAAADDLTTLDGYDIVSASVNGTEIDTSLLSGISYDEFEYTAIYVGYILDGEGEVLSEEDPPDFPSDEDKLASATADDEYIYIQYMSGEFGTDKNPTVLYVLTSDVEQYLGEDYAEDPSLFTVNGYYVVGWAATEDADEALFSTYACVQDIADALKAAAEQDEDTVAYSLTLYPVYAMIGTSSTEADVSVVTYDEIAGDLSAYFSVNDLTVKFAYTDDEGHLTYEVGDSGTTYSYDRTELYKAILAMATVATENAYTEDEVEGYLAYCEKLIELAIFGDGETGEISVEYSLVTMTGTRGTEYGISWEETTDEGYTATYYADGKRLTATVTVYIDTSYEELMEMDDTTYEWFAANYPDGYSGSTFAGWTEDNISWAEVFIELDGDDFIDEFAVVMPDQSSYMTGDDIYAQVYNMLIARGYSSKAALVVLGYLAREADDTDLSGFDASVIEVKGSTYDSASEMVDALIKWFKGYAGDGSGLKSWRSYNGDELALYEAVYGSGYVNISYAEFTVATDQEQAIVSFLYMFEHISYSYLSGNLALMEDIIEELSDRIVYEDESTYDYVTWAIAIAADDSHGYNMSSSGRRGNPDYDCSSLVFYALISNGYDFGTNSPFSTSTMGNYLTEANGFEVIDIAAEGLTTDSLQAGDILWRLGHTAIYIGDGKVAEANDYSSYDYSGGTLSVQAGDQDETEIWVRYVDVSEFTLVYRPTS